MSAGATTSASRRTRTWARRPQHTLILTALFVPAAILLGMLIAIALNQRIRFIGFYRTCIFVPYVASAAATGILASYVFNPQFGGANELLRRVGLPQQQFLESPSQALHRGLRDRAVG